MVEIATFAQTVCVLTKLKWFAFIYFGLILSMNAISQTATSKDTAKAIPTFIVEDAHGRKTNVAQQRGKVVFINFWSLTCVPCKAEMPTINNLQQHYKEDTGLLVLAVDLDHNFRDDLPYFVKKSFSLQVYAPSGAVPRSLFMGELPTTVVIGKDGKIAFFRNGMEHYDTPEFFHIIDSLLAQ
jgi:thiol-disulfide isomerase/thioredoxin